MGNTDIFFFSLLFWLFDNLQVYLACFLNSWQLFIEGSITSSSPTAQPAEVLLQATPPHRRARSAAWSYIFLPEEAWCDLTIHLPAAVLLKEIHIQPHLASLASRYPYNTSFVVVQ